MRKSHFGLPSPAMVVAVSALFVALGGTGYAATQLGHSGRSPASTGNDNASDTKLVKQLAPTLSVATAKHAGTALSAATVGGLQVRKIHFVQQTGNSTNHAILKLGGLVLTVNCGPGGPIVVQAHTTVAGAEVHAGIQSFEGAFSSTDSNTDTYSQGDEYEESDNLTTNSVVDVVDSGITMGDSLNVHLEYSNPHGNVVSANFMSEQGAMSPTVDCLVSGTAIGG
jgi:hypothetical protein